jgi:hypothetical protein
MVLKGGYGRYTVLKQISELGKKNVHVVLHYLHVQKPVAKFIVPDWHWVVVPARQHMFPG